MTDPHTHDDALEQALREALALLPDASAGLDEHAPDAVFDGARWVHDWHNADAELAEVTFDSRVSPELAGVRSAGSLRELTFVTSRYSVEMEIERGPRTARVSGTVSPPLEGEVQLLVGGELFSAPIDDDGNFQVEGVAHGTALAFVASPETKIRLGSFEI